MRGTVRVVPKSAWDANVTVTVGGKAADVKLAALTSHPRAISRSKTACLQLTALTAAVLMPCCLFRICLYP